MLCKSLHSKAKIWLPVWTRTGHHSACDPRVVGENYTLLKNGSGWKEWRWLPGQDSNLQPFG